LVGLSASAASQLRLPAVFGDHMVLQRQTVAPVWGWDDPGQTVAVQASWAAAALMTRADTNGHWRVDLPTTAATGPQTLVVEGSTRVQFDDVLLGEVWIASGQSNMEWSLPYTEGGDERIQAAHHPGLRIFNVANAIAREPLDDCDGRWQVVTPATIGQFSAVGYHFGRELHAQLDVPVGLIGSNWGGTVAESWTSEGSLVELGDFSADLARIEAERSEPDAAAAQAEAARRAWWEHLESADPGGRDAWAAVDLDLGDWSPTEQPAHWSGAGLEEFDGVVWMRRTVEIPLAWVGRDLQLELGPIDDLDTTWFGGERVGGYETMGFWSTPRVYAIPGQLVRAGNVDITVRAIDTGGPGGMSADAAALRLFSLDHGESAAIGLAGTWRMRRGASMETLGRLPSSNGWFNQNRPTALFNGMIAPLVPYALQGAIWYQGESNVGRAAQYARLFPAMIGDWRRHWDRGEFPFYYVQLAPFRYGGNGVDSALLRDAQRLSLATPNTGMAVVLDIGNPDNIHPLNKHDVGHRLALWALGQTYGHAELVYSGPLFRGVRRQGDVLVVDFDHAEGLHAKSGTPKHFEIAGADGVFEIASAEIVGQTVVLSSPLVLAPEQARFAWSDVAEPDLINAAGLPASSFHSHWNQS
jgi:sialate O-acetylesterase